MSMRALCSKALERQPGYLSWNCYHLSWNSSFSPKISNTSPEIFDRAAAVSVLLQLRGSHGVLQGGDAGWGSFPLAAVKILVCDIRLHLFVWNSMDVCKWKYKKRMALQPSIFSYASHFPDFLECSYLECRPVRFRMQADRSVFREMAGLYTRCCTIRHLTGYHL